MSDATRTRGIVARARDVHAPPGWAVPAAALCLAVGAAGFLIGVLIAPVWAWGSFLANFLFWVGLSQAPVAIAAVFVLAPSRWGRVFQRMAIGLSAFLPFALALLVVLWLGRHHLFVPHLGGHPHPWLELGTLFARDAMVILVLGLASLWFVALSLRPDLGSIASGPPGLQRFPRLLTRGWRGEEEESARSVRLMHNLAPVLLLGYGFGYSVLAVDLAMSLVPHLHSTMYPGIYVIGEFYAALAATAVLAAAWRQSERLGDLIAPSQSLDLGNLVWGFAIFWAYVSWAQYFVMWYTNLPEEAAFVALRYRTPPWHGLAWTGLLAAFIVPFLSLFSPALKRHLPALAAIAGIGCLGILIQRFLDVMPFLPGLEPLVYSPIAVAVSLGYLGGVMLCYLWLMRRVPLFPASDPLFFEAVAVRGVEV